MPTDSLHTALTFGWRLLDLAVLVWAAALVWTDVRDQRLPRALTLPAYGVVALACAVAWIAASALPASEADTIRTRVLAALAGAVALRLLYRVARALSPGGVGLGRGDLTLSAPLGAWLGAHGPDAWMWGAWAGFVISGVVALALLLAGRARRRTTIPHGPGMLVGALLAAALAGT